ncbi:MAG: GNAT family N-acetyltransferase [Chitinophagaceae bacterium]
MNSPFPIRYVPFSEINFVKWDDCISKASNGLIYGYSFYLNHMARQWDALVLNDYEAIMPLTWNRKYGIAYLYQPFLTAQLGVFGNYVTAPLLEAFLQAIPSRFRYWDFYLNYKNDFVLEKFNLYQRKNFVLDLQKPYTALFDNYRENIQRNIRKSEQSGSQVVKDFEVKQVTDLAVTQMRKFSKESATNLERFRKLYSHLQQHQQAKTYGVLNERKELVASCVFIFSHNRAYYILVGNHPDGRTTGASHRLIDGFIKDHAGKNLLLDFEGSDIRNLAFFYNSFGAVEELYPGLRQNKLPVFLKWLKK